MEDANPMHDQFDAAIRDTHETAELFQAISGAATGTTNPEGGVERIMEQTRQRLMAGALSADMRSSPVAAKFLPTDGHENSPVAATGSPQN